MRPEILGIFVPIVFLIGLFTVIALNILFKFKAKELTANRSESLDEWYKADTQIKLAKVERRAARNRGIGLRISGLLIGIGLGVTIGLIIIACGGFSSVGKNDQFDQIPVAVFSTIALSVFFGGAGMIGAYLLERRLDSKKQEK